MQHESKGEDAKEYFSLIRGVGSNGRYQTIIVILAVMVCLQNGIISLGTSYYFAVPPYTNCPPPHQGIAACTKYACSLPVEKRAQYEQTQIKELKTLGTQFGDHHCEKRDAVETAKGMYFLGAVAGFIIVGILSDNIGRRLSLIFCLGLGAVGYLVMLTASSLLVAGTGNFMVGFSVQSGFNLVFCLLTELLQNDKRQKMQTFIQAWLPVGGILIILAFYLFKQWKFIFSVFCLIPFIICFLFTCFFVVETPQFLVKRFEVEEIRKNLRFIAWVNGTESQFDQKAVLSENHIESLKAEYSQQLKQQHSIPFTYFDLFRYPSLRMITICSITLFFAANILYNAPLMLIDEFGFDFYLNGVILNVSELITYFFTFVYITRIPRKTLNITTSAVSFFCSFLLIFIHTRRICAGADCSSHRVVLEMVTLFILRFAVSLIYQVLYLYVAQLFPVQVEGMALGLSCILGHIPNALLPELINICHRHNFPIMTIFTFVSLLSLVFSFLGPETYGRQPQQMVEEIRHGVHRHPSIDGFQLVKASEK